MGIEGYQSLNKFLENHGLEVPSNQASLIDWDKIQYLEVPRVNTIAGGALPAYIELKLEDIDDVILKGKYDRDVSKALFCNSIFCNEKFLKDPYRRSSDDIIIHYVEGKYRVAGLAGFNNNLIVPIAKSVVRKHPEIEFPPFLCEIHNYPFKGDEINPELVKETDFLLHSVRALQSYVETWISSYTFIRNGVPEGVLFGSWPNKEGIPLDFEIHFTDKKKLEKFIEDLEKIKKINTIFGNDTVNMFINDNRQDFQYVYGTKVITSNELEQVLLEENEKKKNPKPLTDNKNKEVGMFKELQIEQSKKLTKEEKEALIRYKGQLYYAINKVLSSIRDTDGRIDEYEFEPYIEEGYAKLEEAYKSITNALVSSSSNSSSTKSDGEKLFGVSGFPTYERYKDVVLSTMTILTGALKKVHLKEDLTVYRRVKRNDINELGNAFLSTSISMNAALQFNRTESRKEKEILYKIKLLKGSPIAFYSEELRTGKINPDKPFSDDQGEVLIDAWNFDFHVGEVKEYTNLTLINTNGIDKSTKLYVAEVTAKPKVLEEKLDSNHKQTNTARGK